MILNIMTIMIFMIIMIIMIIISCLASYDLTWSYLVSLGITGSCLIRELILIILMITMGKMIIVVTIIMMLIMIMLIITIMIRMVIMMRIIVIMMIRSCLVSLDLTWFHSSTSLGLLGSLLVQPGLSGCHRISAVVSLLLY